MMLRPAKTNDAPQIAELMEQLGYKITAIDLKKKIKSTNGCSDKVFVAEENGNIEGVISCHITPCFHQISPVGRITSLVINQSSRGKGIGKLLLENADSFFIDNGCKRAEVTSGDHRHEAHNFYQNHGFKIDERRFLKEYS